MLCELPIHGCALERNTCTILICASLGTLAAGIPPCRRCTLEYTCDATAAKKQRHLPPRSLFFLVRAAAEWLQQARAWCNGPHKLHDILSHLKRLRQARDRRD